MPLSVTNALGSPRKVERPQRLYSHTVNPPQNRAMTDRKTDSFETYRPSFDTDRLRPALLLAGTQIMVALLGAVLLTNGALA